MCVETEKGHAIVFLGGAAKRRRFGKTRLDWTEEPFGTESVRKLREGGNTGIRLPKRWRATKRSEAENGEKHWGTMKGYELAAIRRAWKERVKELNRLGTHTLAHSGHRISWPSVMNPLPTREVVHCAQMKQSLCQCRSSNEMNLAPPMPGTQFQT